MAADAFRMLQLIDVDVLMFDFVSRCQLNITA